MDAELVMDMRITWDCGRIKEIDQAKNMILGYKRMGYLIEKTDGTPMERFASNLEEVIIRAKKIAGNRVMKILCAKGDERLVWDKDNGKEAKEAKKKYEELLGKGFKAYSVDSSGKKSRRIEEFDVDAEEILMIPPTYKS